MPTLADCGLWPEASRGRDAVPVRLGGGSTSPPPRPYAGKYTLISGALSILDHPRR